MISYRKLIPCIYIAGGKAIKWFNDREVLADNVVELAKHYSDRGADELLIFDLSDSDDDHEASLNLLRQIHNVISIPMVAGGNIKRMEDVQRILYSGAKRVILNFSKPDSAEMMAKAAEQFADLVIVTQDNPRTEDPNKIEADILTGFSRMEDVGVIPDREEAIKFTIENAVEDDVIVIAGKGHENYQIIGDKTLHFSDQEVAEAYLTKK